MTLFYLETFVETFTWWITPAPIEKQVEPSSFTMDKLPGWCSLKALTCHLGTSIFEALTSLPPINKTHEGKCLAGKCPAAKCPLG